VSTPGPFRGSASPYSRQRLRAAAFRRVTRDVYVLARVQESLALLLDALLLVAPDAVPSHTTAARWLGLPVDRDPRVHLVRRPGRPVLRGRGVRTHRATLTAQETVVHRGRRVTSPARTFVDLAGTLDLVSLVALGDAVARRSGLRALAAAVDAADGGRGVRTARAALALVDPGSDSPAETRVRLVLHDAGYRRMRHGVEIHLPGGGWVATADLADPVARVALQYDGLVHLGDDPERRRADIDRDELSRQAGWQVVVLTAVDLRQPGRLLAKVAAAYARSGASPS
jgi:hypothetical protein